MTATMIFKPRRQLARRVTGELEVTLYWDANDNSTIIEIWHPASHGTLLRFVVPGEDALDAFYQRPPQSARSDTTLVLRH